MKEITGGTFDFSSISFVDKNWATLVVMVALLILTINAVVYRRKLVLSLQSLYSNRSFSQLSKEGKLFSEGNFIFSLPFILLSWAACIQQLCTHYFPILRQQISYIQLFGFICLALIVMFFLKMLLDYILFELFECSNERYVFHVSNYSFLLNSSLALLLGFVVVQYTNFYPFYIVISLILIALYIIDIYKKYNLKSKRINLFQFFLYFCTLEILPCLVIGKLLFNYGNKGF